MTISRLIVKVAYYDLGAADQTDWTTYDIDNVLLTEDALIAQGGSPYYTGHDYKLVLRLGYQDDTGTQDGLADLTTATLTFEMYNSAGDAITTTPASPTLTVDADQTSWHATPAGNKGQIAIVWADTDEPESGEHNWQLECDLGAGKAIYICRGKITVREAMD